MKLLFKQRFFYWFDGYDIFNEIGTVVYVAKGQLAWGAVIAKISKEIFNRTDTYSMEIYNPQDALQVLLLVLAIDAEKCSRRD